MHHESFPPMLASYRESMPFPYRPDIKFYGTKIGGYLLTYKKLRGGYMVTGKLPLQGNSVLHGR